MTEVFERVVCGVDASEAGAVAAKLAARVTEPHGELVLVAVDDPSAAAHGWATTAFLEELAADVRRGLERGAAAAAPAHRIEAVLLEGNRLDCLRSELDRREATLMVVGSHDHSRAAGILLGSVATHMLHEAPCSVLVARAPQAEWWPYTIVVGVDGSPESAEAAAAARRLGDRFGSQLRFVAATADPHVDRDAAYEIAPELEEVPLGALTALHELSEDVDLVVVGSRGLRGIRALGSASERVAHDARSSVLVARRSAPVSSDR